MSDAGSIVTQKRNSVPRVIQSTGIFDAHGYEAGILPYLVNRPAFGGDLHTAFQVSVPLQTTTSFRSYRAQGVKNYEVDPTQLLRDNQQHNLYPYDNGHEFFTSKESISLDLPEYRAVSFNGTCFYQGPLFAYEALKFISKPPNERYPFGAVNDAIGTEFLARLRPTKAAANVAQALFELFQDVPRLPFVAIEEARRVTQLLRKGSTEYLNVVFGWAPLVSDVLKICRAIVYSDSILQQYRRDSGRLIRRRAVNPVVITDNSANDFSDRLCNNNDDSYTYDLWQRQGFGSFHMTTKATEQYRFSGAFEYLLAGDDSVFEKSARYAQLANHLLGVRMDVNLLWELTPWSWLADWFTSIGSSIALMNDINQDNLVIAYGYLQRESIVTIDFQHDGAVATGSGPTPPCSLYYKKVQKERVRATPYGFGVDLSSLSESQAAILGALGLTKSPRRFWWG
jgi:hypothetical protein